MACLCQGCPPSAATRFWTSVHFGDMRRALSGILLYGIPAPVTLIGHYLLNMVNTFFHKFGKGF